jgi:hypothetical protein
MQLAPELWADLHCSFCGRGRKQVKCLIADPNGGCICDECVGLSDQLLEEKKFRIPRLTNEDLNLLADLKAEYAHEFVLICDLSQKKLPPDLIALFPEELCRRNHLVPFQKAHNRIIVVTVDPAEAIIFGDELSVLTGCNIVITLITTLAQIEAAIEMYYPKKEAPAAEPA